MIGDKVCGMGTCGEIFYGTVIDVNDTGSMICVEHPKYKNMHAWFWVEDCRSLAEMKQTREYVIDEYDRAISFLEGKPTLAEIVF